MNKLLLEVNFRLRNTEEYNQIKDKFIENGFETIVIENINNREFEIELLLNYINENKLREKYGKISIISNIEDAIFVWHRIYNFFADDFIFFIDKYNYSLLKGKIYEELANMNAIEKESIDEIYMNLNSDNIEKIGSKINKIKNCKYISNIDKLDINKNKFKKEESKKYLCGIEKIEHIFKQKSIKIIKLDTEEDKIELNELLYMIKEKTDIFLLYCIICYKEAFGNREIIGKWNNTFKFCFEHLEKLGEKEKFVDKIFEILENNSNINFLWKIQICQLLVYIGEKDYRILKLSIKYLKENMGYDKYHYGILIQLFFNSYINKVIIYDNFNLEMREIIKELSVKYTEDIMIKRDDNDNEIKKIAVIVDQLMSLKHSTAKATIDYAINIKKYIKNSEIKIFVEDNFRQNNEEGILINQYNSANSRKVSEEHYNYLIENKVDDIEIYYSDVYLNKKDRVREIIGKVAEFNPEIILNMNNAYSLSMECLSKYFRAYYLTLGLINWQDNQIYNFYYESFVESSLPNFKNNVILKTKGVTFEKKERKYERSNFGFDKEDFIMVSVSLIPETDFDKEFIDEMVKVIENYSNIKLLLVGTDNLKYIDEKYRKLIDSKIKFIKYEKELGALYQICDIYVNPQRDGGGYSIGEAMSYGIPILSIRGMVAGDFWIGESNSCISKNEYIKKIERLLKENNFYMEESKKVLDRVNSLSYKKHIDELITYFNLNKENGGIV